MAMILRALWLADFRSDIFPSRTVTMTIGSDTVSDLRAMFFYNFYGEKFDFFYAFTNTKIINNLKQKANYEWRRTFS